MAWLLQLSLIIEIVALRVVVLYGRKWLFRIIQADFWWPYFSCGALGAQRT
jgi:hypothetical protein